MVASIITAAVISGVFAVLLLIGHVAGGWKTVTYEVHVDRIELNTVQRIGDDGKPVTSYVQVILYRWHRGLGGKADFYVADYFPIRDPGDEINWTAIHPEIFRARWRSSGQDYEATTPEVRMTQSATDPEFADRGRLSPVNRQPYFPQRRPG